MNLPGLTDLLEMNGITQERRAAVFAEIGKETARMACEARAEVLDAIAGQLETLLLGVRFSARAAREAARGP